MKREGFCDKAESLPFFVSFNLKLGVNTFGDLSCSLRTHLGHQEHLLVTFLVVFPPT